jgi:alkylresorcinol/alkylpyrone synthase
MATGPRGRNGHESAHPRLIAVATATPPHRAGQGDAKSLAAELFRETLAADPRLLRVFDHTEIDGRHTCMPLEWYGADHDFGEMNALYVEHAVRLSVAVAGAALGEAGLTPRDVDHIVFVSSTGLATPSIDARLANVLGLRADLRRTPIWGLGCAGGAAGLARARDFARADPESTILMIALELCTLTFQRNDLSRRNLVAASLFGDGAAAVVVRGAGVAGPADGLSLVASSSTLWPDSLDVMGWDVDGAGLHVVFSKDIPTIVRDRVRPGLAAFLETQGLRLGTLEHVVAHPGGVKVLRAYAESLGRSPDAFRHSRDVLREYGNMSSPTCLFVLERFLRRNEIGPGEHAVVAALGPGFAAEYVLLRGADA